MARNETVRAAAPTQRREMFTTTPRDTRDQLVIGPHPCGSTFRVRWVNGPLEAIAVAKELALPDGRYMLSRWIKGNLWREYGAIVVMGGAPEFSAA